MSSEDVPTAREMAEAVRRVVADPALHASIRKTQEMLGAIIDKYVPIMSFVLLINLRRPSLTVRMLSRPPVAFLFAVYRSVRDTTGFGAGLLESDDLPTTRSEKIRFLVKLIGCISMALNDREIEVLAVPARIVSGRDGLAANAMLQALAKAANLDMSTKNGAVALTVQCGEVVLYQRSISLRKIIARCQAIIRGRIERQNRRLQVDDEATVDCDSRSQRDTRGAAEKIQKPSENLHVNEEKCNDSSLHAAHESDDPADAFHGFVPSPTNNVSTEPEIHTSPKSAVRDDVLSDEETRAEQERKEVLKASQEKAAAERAQQMRRKAAEVARRAVTENTERLRRIAEAKAVKREAVIEKIERQRMDAAEAAQRKLAAQEARRKQQAEAARIEAAAEEQRRKEEAAAARRDADANLQRRKEEEAARAAAAQRIELRRKAEEVEAAREAAAQRVERRRLEKAEAARREADAQEAERRRKREAKAAKREAALRKAELRRTEELADKTANLQGAKEEAEIARREAALGKPERQRKKEAEAARQTELLRLDAANASIAAAGAMELLEQKRMAERLQAECRTQLSKLRAKEENFRLQQSMLDVQYEKVVEREEKAKKARSRAQRELQKIKPLREKEEQQRELLEKQERELAHKQQMLLEKERKLKRQRRAMVEGTSDSRSVATSQRSSGSARGVGAVYAAAAKTRLKERRDKEQVSVEVSSCNEEEKMLLPEEDIRRTYEALGGGNGVFGRFLRECVEKDVEQLVGEEEEVPQTDVVVPSSSSSSSSLQSSGKSVKQPLPALKEATKLQMEKKHVKSTPKNNNRVSPQPTAPGLSASKTRQKRAATRKIAAKSEDDPWLSKFDRDFSHAMKALEQAR